MFAFVTTFQVVTLEGWTDIMSRVIDAWSSASAIIAFLLLIVFGGIIALNIVLAVISGSLDSLERGDALRLMNGGSNKEDKLAMDGRRLLETPPKNIENTMAEEDAAEAEAIANNATNNCKTFQNGTALEVTALTSGHNGSSSLRRAKLWHTSLPFHLHIRISWNAAIF